ncbi:MAG: general secretion pathway protein GspE [Geobacteraceae bacterium]|nr:general secretion pathway protein GspE [Geobacteraceae bacterium]
MAPRIGELLVNDGLLTRKQLEEALKCQVIFGGRLGTNLVEMGIIEELDLLRILGKQLEMPYVSPEQLACVPPEVIKLIPREIAEEYKIIPLSLEKKRLTVAMWDPSDLSAIDAVSFITGYIIIPVVCSELRLLLALEQYYGVKREVRYIQLSGGTGIRSREPAATGRQGGGAAPIAPQENFPFENLSGEPTGSAAAGHWGEEPEPGEVAEILPTVPNTAPPPEIFQFDTQQVHLPLEEPDIVDLVEAPPEIQPPPPPARPPQQPPARPPQPTAKMVAPPATAPVAEAPPSSLDALLAVLAEATDRDAIAEALVAYVGQNFERVALFMVKGKIAAGWKGRLRRKAIPGFENFQLPLDEPSVLKIVADTKNFYLGPVLDTPGNSKTLAALGGGAADTALLIPLMMMGRVVTIFYVDGGAELGKNLFDLQKLVGKAALAFEILILKNKILLG